MSWDNTKQFYDVTPSAKREFGWQTLGAGGTVEVVTRLRAIRCARATPKSGFVVAGSVECDGTITSGAVTFADSNGAVNAAGIFWYELLGY